MGRLTQAQIAAAQALPYEELLDLAVRAMHALNRRAKADRDGDRAAPLVAPFPNESST